MSRRPAKTGDGNRTKKRVISGIIILVMVMSVVGFLVGALGSNALGGRQVSFGKYTFSYRERMPDGRWELKVEKQRFRVFSTPQELVDLPYDSGITALLASPVFFVSIDPLNESMRTVRSPWEEGVGLALYRFEQDFPKRDAFVAHALSRPVDNDTLPGLESWPVWTCANATPTVPVVVIRPGENTTLSLEGSCIVMEASRGEELKRAYDRVLLAFLGVMP